MTPYEEASAKIREEVKEALVAYGQQRTLLENTKEVERAAEQTLNFFEALLTHHKPKMPFENKTLSELSPNKRALFSAKEYSEVFSEGGNEYWGCRPDKLRGVHGIHFVFRKECVRLTRPKKAEPDLWYKSMVALIEDCRGDSFFHIDQLKKWIPHALKDIRTNSCYYWVCEHGIEDPTTENHVAQHKAVLLTETVVAALRVFDGAVSVHVFNDAVVFYNRWFAVQLPRIKK